MFSTAIKIHISNSTYEPSFFDILFIIFDYNVIRNDDTVHEFNNKNMVTQNVIIIPVFLILNWIIFDWVSFKNAAEGGLFFRLLKSQKLIYYYTKMPIYFPKINFTL